MRGVDPHRTSETSRDFGGTCEEHVLIDEVSLKPRCKFATMKALQVVECWLHSCRACRLHGSRELFVPPPRAALTQRSRLSYRRRLQNSASPNRHAHSINIISSTPPLP